MTTIAQAQVSFTTDAQLKAQVMQKTKDMGMSLKALLTFCMQAFNQGQIQVGVQNSYPVLKWTAYEQKAWEEGQKAYKNGDYVAWEKLEQELPD